MTQTPIIPSEAAGPAERSGIVRELVPSRQPGTGRDRAEDRMTDDIRQIDAAIISHDEWKARLLTAVESGSSDLNPDEVRADDRCPFGKWMAAVSPGMKASLHFERVRDRHARFHQAAADVLSLVLGGEGARALTSLEFGSEYVSASVLLVDEMERWRAELQRGESGGLPRP